MAPSGDHGGTMYPYGSGGPGAAVAAAAVAAAAGPGGGSYQSRPPAYPPQGGPPYPSQGGPPSSGSPQGAAPEPYPARAPPQDPAYQVYPGSQPGSLYGTPQPQQAQGGQPGGSVVPPGKGAPQGAPTPPYQREVYPKRHPDFMKPPPQQEPYPPPHMAGPYPAPHPQQAPSQQYPDRGQYPYRPPHMMTPPASSMQQQGWGREGQYRGYQQGSPYGGPPHPGAPPERWEGPRIGEGAPGAAWAVSRGPQGEPYPPQGPLMAQQTSQQGPNAMAHKMAAAAAYARDRAVPARGQAAGG
ncbi:hypothetical protein HPB47_021188 [Ixodes persulcatus]|uniref:Uncharacterized protein n=1 Tax=Ixodes persulcatus TaxID=34615 RepID=A0AC60QDC1_IXOPE|nr:hypothetical protein HPB47_021188 [Ixodes persulcatus]